MQTVQPQDQMLVNFEEVTMSDHQFAKHCHDKGWEGKVNPLKNYTQFILPTGSVIALVRYKNDAPVNRWIYLPKEVTSE